MKTLKTLAIRILLAVVVAAPLSLTAPALAAPPPQSAPAATPQPQPVPAAQQQPARAAEHVVTEAEIQGGIDQAVHSDAADRQAIRDLLARPEVRRIAGQAGLNLTRANDAIPTLSGPELQRLAAQAREVNSQAIAGDRISMNTTTIIIILLIVVLILVLAG